MRKNNKTMETTLKAIRPIIDKMLMENNGNYKIVIGDVMRGDGFTILIVGVPNNKYRLIRNIGRYYMYVIDSFVDCEVEVLTETSDNNTSRWIESQFEDYNISLDITTYYI